MTLDSPSILERMHPVEGWLNDDEAALLIATAAAALRAPGERPAIVEVGSYCGRSTVVLGLTAQAACPGAKVYAIDPHTGTYGAVGDDQRNGPPTLERFTRNIADAGLTDVVVPIVAYSYKVHWDDPIRLLFVDGLHDAANVARDFNQFEWWVERGGYVAFHDYAPHFPGVAAIVDGVLAGVKYRRVDQAGSLIVVQRNQ